jgi:hypothetical protein
MATIVKPPSGTWKAVIRRKGWPTSSMAFRTKRDAEDWARRTENEMIRGVYVRRSSSEKKLLQDALKCYLKEFTPHKTPIHPTGGEDAGKAADQSARTGKSVNIKEGWITYPW